MNIFIYWNKRDNDSKKMYGFLKNGNLIKRLNETHTVYMAPMYGRFDIEDIITFGNQVSDTIKNVIQNCDLVMFFTHGEKDRILKSRYNDENMKESFTLIDMTSASLLKGKRVIAICCSSAEELGRYCTDNDITLFYIGFKKDIEYADSNSEKQRRIMYDAYSSAFEKSLLNALEYGYSAKIFSSRLKHNLNSTITERITKQENNRSLEKYSNFFNSFYAAGIQSLECFGKENEFIFVNK